MKNILLYLGVLSISLTTYAQQTQDIDPYFEIQSVTVQEEDISSTDLALLANVYLGNYYYDLFVAQAANPMQIGKVIAVTNDLIALGERIYQIIERGKPIVNLDSAPISVLPKNGDGEAVEAFSLTHWRNPKAKKFTVEAKNGFGMVPVSFEFTVLFSYGGKSNGKGAFISGAQIIPTKAHVSWGYELEANFTVQQIINQGTSDDPVAAAVLSLKYNIVTTLKSARYNALFFINGNGVAAEI